MPTSLPITLKARWVLPINRAPIAHGQVTLGPTCLLNIGGPEPTQGEVLELGNCLLLPRLVNAHTHLEFSSLARPFAGGDGFPSWVREVIKWRQAREAGEGRPHAAQQDAIARGLAECRARGTGLVGEIASAPWPTAAYQTEPPVVAFLEQLGVLPGQAPERLAAVTSRLADLRGDQLMVGLSPHAPYSLSQQLFDGMCQLAGERELPVAMHLAETPEEMAWLQGADNGFTQLQERLGVLASSQWRPELRDLLEQLARLPRVLVVHGNYLAPREWEVLARHRRQMSLVYCPRTHQHFGHSRYPLPELLQAGVRVAVGTDSRASTPDLDLLAELRLIRQRYPELPAGEVLELGTRAAAEALGEAGRWGELCPGARSELLIVPGPKSDVTNPAEWLLESNVSPDLIDWKSAWTVAQAARQ